MATSFRGRTLTYEIFPFSFLEYLRFQGIDINLYSSKSLSHIKHAIAQYLVHGGFPETINASPDIRTRTILDYTDLIFYKDIKEYIPSPPRRSLRLKVLLQVGREIFFSSFALIRVIRGQTSSPA